MQDALIAIVDDDEAIRLSVASLLTRAGFRVEIFESGDDFLSGRVPGPFSCILLDIQMPGSDGLAVLRALAARGESPPVLVITAHGDVDVAVKAMKLGAHDFVEKPYGADDLLAAIGKAHASEGASILRREAAALVETLSERQRQVLQGILRGLQNKVIAFELGLSIRTVESYRAALLQKLGVRGIADAVRLALAAGLADDAVPPSPGAL